MSVEIPQPEAPPDIPPASSPEALFATHVEQVRTKGDALDVVRWLWPSHFGKITAAAGTIGGTVYQEHGPGAVVGVSALAVAIIGFSTAATDQAWKRHGRPNAESRIDLPGQAANDANYELYAIGKQDRERQVAMRWYGPVQDKTMPAAAQLHRIAQLAKDNNVSQLVLASPLAAEIFADPLPWQPTTMQAWLRRHRNLYTAGRTQEQIYAVSPDAWQQFLTDHPDAAHTNTSVATMRAYGPLTAGHKGLQAVVQMLGLPTTPDAVVSWPDEDAASPRTVQAAIRVPRPLHGRVAHTLQDELVLRTRSKAHIPETSMRGQTKRRLVAGIVGLLASAGIVGGSTVAADASYKRITRIAAEQIAREHGIDPTKAHIDDAAIEDRVNSWSGINRIWGDWQHARTKAYDFMARNRHTSDLHKVGDQQIILSGGVGNVVDDRSRPMWRLTAHNMSPTGEWPTAVSATIDGYVPSTGSPTAVNWDLSEQYRKTQGATRVPVPVELEAPQGSWIKVEGDVSRFDAGVINDKATAGLYLPIPVRDGTVPVAGNLDGKPLTLWSGPNGAYAFVLPLDSQAPNGKLTYWVQPRPGAGPRAIGQTVINQKAGQLPPIKEQVIKEFLEAHLPQLRSTTFKEGGDAFAAYIHNNFTYDLAPLPTDSLRHVLSWEDFVKLVWSGKEANCNVANTLVAIRYPDLNGVFEFNNGPGGDPGVLDLQEAHMNLVRWGEGSKRIDATPYRDTTIKQDSHPAPSAPLLPLLLVPLSLAAAAYVYRRREAIVAGGASVPALIHNKRITRAQRNLEMTPPEIVRAALAAVHHLWSKPGTVLTPAHVAKQVRITNNISGPQAVAKLTRSDMHTKQVVQAIRNQPGVTPAMRKAIKAARRAARQPRSVKR